MIRPSMSLLALVALPIWRRRGSAAEAPQAPAGGEPVWLRRARSKEARARGRVAGSGPGRLSLVLESEPFAPFKPRTRVELEWLVAEGLVRAHGTVGIFCAGPPPLLEIAVRGSPRLAERRIDLRAAIALAVSGWSLQDPTRLLSGRTVDLSTSGALLELPMMPEAATTLELRISLPDDPLSALGHVVRRRPGGLVAVRLAPKRPADIERLARFVALRLREDGVPGT
jgi:hypothetical protein